MHREEISGIEHPLSRANGAEIPIAEVKIEVSAQVEDSIVKGLTLGNRDMGNGTFRDAQILEDPHSGGIM